MIIALFEPTTESPKEQHLLPTLMMINAEKLFPRCRKNYKISTADFLSFEVSVLSFLIRRGISLSLSDCLGFHRHTSVLRLLLDMGSLHTAQQRGRLLVESRSCEDHALGPA